ncbi:MAG: DUF3574 domain-containing protein [Xanthomonadaceae bacterium]|nr:DUF3574 domain-containing protein [Xanthomonadaceae bacterium]
MPLTHLSALRPACRFALLGALTLLLAVGIGCASTSSQSAKAIASAALQGDAARPNAATAWRRSELYFGVGDPHDPTSRIDQVRWQAFLEREVTPRFPDGLTVFDAYGQWLFRGQTSPERLDSKVLVIIHPDIAGDRAKIDAIRSAWKTETGHQSVLWASQLVEISF